ncbi:hypothetical protein GCM10023220_05600 [Streptomyces ziwulingensis]|uniref:Uncharacterized protein n=1 Tax=Streptomyces ziwulingensis TaxID=1045501 RepID=A0ABP9ARS3_9ACTN
MAEALQLPDPGTHVGGAALRGGGGWPDGRPASSHRGGLTTGLAAVVAAVVAAVMVAVVSTPATATPAPLGTAASSSVLAGSGVTNTGDTVLSQDLRVTSFHSRAVGAGPWTRAEAGAGSVPRGPAPHRQRRSAGRAQAAVPPGRRARLSATIR